MKKTKQFIGLLLCCLLAATGCTTAPDASTRTDSSTLQTKARETLDSIYTHYGVEGTCLLREYHPTAVGNYNTSLLTEAQASEAKLYSYLWPYAEMFAAVEALYEATGDNHYLHLLEKQILPGLEEYLDDSRKPAAYATYIRTAPLSKRYYDDNAWVGLNFINLYQATQENKYLDKAKLIWQFIESGMDNKLGGGIYWCEQEKDSKNTCSNAPAAVLALKLFQATNDSTYFKYGKQLYKWVKDNLQDTATDYLYFDNIKLNGKIGKAKYAYNSGQMMQAATLLYQLTADSTYLADAQLLARSCKNYFFRNVTLEEGEEGEEKRTSTISLPQEGDIWFTAVMLRGYIELYKTDGNNTYLTLFRQSLDYAWLHARDDTGLFHTDFSGLQKDKRKLLLTQAAMVEMYARLAAIIP